MTTTLTLGARPAGRALTRHRPGDPRPFLPLAQ